METFVCEAGLACEDEGRLWASTAALGFAECLPSGLQPWPLQGSHRPLESPCLLFPDTVSDQVRGRAVSLGSVRV